MRKIRSDLVGVVLASGVTLAPGDEVPDDLSVDDSLVESSSKSEKAAPAPEKSSKAPEPKKTSPEPEKPTGNTGGDDEDDFSDLLGDTSEKSTPSAKRGGRRGPASKQG